MAKTKYEIKTAGYEDSLFVLQLRNQKSVRKHCLENKQKIPLKKHLEWFKQNKQHIKIIIVNKKPAGYYHKSPQGMISIYLNQNQRSKGIGSQILKNLRGKAIILNTNQRSQKAFTKAGYKEIGKVYKK